MSEVFISYSRKNSHYLNQLQRVLEDLGIDLWIDTDDLAPSSRWRQEIEEAIEGCAAFIYLLSPESISSRYCWREFEYAIELNKKIIPILLPELPGEEIPIDIGQYQWIKWEDIEGGHNDTKSIDEVIYTDFEWEKFLADLTSQAKKWERKPDASRLLYGKKLADILNYVEDKGADAVSPTILAYIEISEIEEKKSKRRRRLARAFFVSMLVITAAISLVLFDKTPAVVEVDGTVINIRNRFKYQFFSEDLESTISTYVFPEKLASSGPRILLVGTDDDGENPGKLFAFNMNGKILWEFQNRQDPFGGPLGNFKIRLLQISQVLGNGDYQIVVTSQKSDWYPTEIAMLSPDGEQLSSYWNGGFVYNIIPHDLNKDGIEELVIYAVNNNLGYFVVSDETQHPATVFALSAAEGYSGQSFPPFLESSPEATEMNNWIAVFNPFEVPGVEIGIVSVGNRDLIEVVLKPKGGYVFLDEFGEIWQVGLSDYWRTQYEDASPRDFMCFLIEEDGGWVLPADISITEYCPWFD